MCSVVYSCELYTVLVFKRSQQLICDEVLQGGTSIFDICVCITLASFSPYSEIMVKLVRLNNEVLLLTVEYAVHTLYVVQRMFILLITDLLE